MNASCDSPSTLATSGRCLQRYLAVVSAVATSNIEEERADELHVLAQPGEGRREVR